MFTVINNNYLLKISLLFLMSLFFFSRIGYAEIKVDGRLDEPEWSDSRSFRDFVVIDPLTFEKPELATEVKLLSLKEGLAVAFICEQPQDVIRTRTVTQRDAANIDSDSVSVMIDFNGTKQIAYEFTVSITGSYRDGTITNETDFKYDWDGRWERAVYEEKDRWTAELLIPWSIVAMRDGENGKRKFGVFLQRVLQHNKQTFAFPAASIKRPQFVSDFAEVEVSQYSEKEFDVWPYLTVLSDLKNDSTQAKAGLDVFWKPSGNFQLAATLNPDFGQVESDDLVIDFSAIEVLFSDKRPFFTENQALFDLRTPNRGYVVYTRRIGGPNDKDGRPSDINGALKVIGSAGSVDYGVLAAHEADSYGRSFFAGRMFLPAEKWSLGTFTTYVKRPYLDRTALVNSLDYEIQPNNLWRLQGQFLVSKINAASGDSSDFGAWYRLHYTPSKTLRFEMDLSHWGKKLDFSDMGYIMRTNLEEMFIFGQWSQSGFSEGSRAASVDWTLYTLRRRNAEHTRLQSRIIFQRQEKLRSGSNMDLMLSIYSSGYDDLVSRNHGLVYFDQQLNGSLTYTAQRRGAWAKSVSLNLMQEGRDGTGGSLSAGTTWFPNDKFNIDFKVIPRWSNDWLIWLHDDKFGSYSLRQVTGAISPSWFPAEGHEFRLKTQWIVMKAYNGQCYYIGPNGRLMPDNNAVNDFSMLNFGLQLRYRYEIAPLSDLYIVYSRGGLERVENSDKGVIDLLGSSTKLRDSDQILVKLRYRF
jgi:hypothetical protein